MIRDKVNVFMVDDDEDDYIITKDYLYESERTSFDLTWSQDYDTAVEAILAQTYDVYLLDLNIGGFTGFDLLKVATEANVSRPFILLTGADDHKFDRRAMELGAADYLVKGEFNGQMLERSIRYAMRQSRILNELKISEARYRHVLETQTELVKRFLPDTTLTFVNQAYARFHNTTPEELINRKWFDYSPVDIRLLNQRIDSLRNNQAVVFEKEYVNEYGEKQWYQWSETPIFNDAGELIEVQSVGFDISERKYAEEKLQEALQKEIELGELKSRFVSMASHEFRTPLTTILSVASFLEMADAQIDSEKRIARLQKIQTAANNMTELLNDVLTYGKAEANRLEYYPKAIEFVQFCGEIIEDLRAVAGANYTLKFISQLEHLKIIADEKLIRQIITNLLTNAIKYSPNGGEVSFELHSDATHFQFTVCDQGIGIPLKDQAKLFEPFHRAVNARDIAGTGLGLAITKKAVELHSGTISFESIQGQGTCFTVVIPHRGGTNQ